MQKRCCRCGLFNAASTYSPTLLQRSHMALESLAPSDNAVSNVKQARVPHGHLETAYPSFRTKLLILDQIGSAVQELYVSRQIRDQSIAASES